MINEKKLCFVYDDRVRPSGNISNVVGESSYGGVLYKRTKLMDQFKAIVFGLGISIEKFIVLRDDKDVELLYQSIKDTNKSTLFVHIMSYAVVINLEHFKLAIKKGMFADKAMTINHDCPLVYFVPDSASYIKFLEHISSHDLAQLLMHDDESIIKPNDFVIDISNLQNFLQFFSGGFEARHFNALKGDSFTLTKTSTDKLKMQKEHDFYHLLPPTMKGWFVAPYDLSINTRNASYTMERLNVPDMALQWIHGAISPSDLEQFLDKAFYFINNRPQRKVEKGQFMKTLYNLYLVKVIERVEGLKGLEEFQQISLLIKTGTRFNTIDEILNEYKSLFDVYCSTIYEYIEVIGHGDLCFSNILYDKNTNLMRFIDPKGAIYEEDLWTNRYYDVAKLSHSIFGRYDYINNEMFSVSLNSECLLELDIEVPDLSVAQNIFYRKLVQFDFDIFLVRLFETSLFLSMLPLHIDNPRKVFAFILNAINIIEELKSNAKQG